MPPQHDATTIFPDAMRDHHHHHGGGVLSGATPSHSSHHRQHHEATATAEEIFSQKHFTCLPPVQHTCSPLDLSEAASISAREPQEPSLSPTLTSCLVDAFSAAPAGIQTQTVGEAATTFMPHSSFSQPAMCSPLRSDPMIACEAVSEATAEATSEDWDGLLSSLNIETIVDDDGQPIGHVSTVVDPEEFERVAAPLRRHGMQAVAIRRIHNQMCWRRFASTCEIDQAKGHYNAVSPLYHTTRAPMEQVIAQGLDQRLAGSGYFGRGIYFSDDPLKANMYHRGPPGEQRRMLQASVLLGRVREFPAGECDQTLLREPKGADSVKGNMTGHAEYVVYDSARVLLEYEITYTSNPMLNWQTALDAHQTIWRHRNPGQPLPPHLTSVMALALHTNSRRAAVASVSSAAQDGPGSPLSPTPRSPAPIAALSFPPVPPPPPGMQIPAT